MERWNTPATDALLRTVLELRSLREAKDFFRDLLTEQELIELSKRWRAVRMLDRSIPYTQIVKATGLSSTTIARISKWFKHGRGGYRRMLRRRRGSK